MKILITSGGCKVPIDSVRHIGNFSSGRYGAELANAFMQYEKNHVLFFRERGSNLPLRWTQSGRYLTNITEYEYRNYEEYLSVKDLIKREQPDIIISAAAISDYIVDKIEGKISSDNDELIIKLRKGEKVIKSFRELAPNSVIVGFKLLVSPDLNQAKTAVEKVFNSGVDFVVYNDLTELRKGNSTRTLIHRSGEHKDFNDPNYLVEFIENYWAK